MAYDPYGYETENQERAAEAGAGSSALAGVSVLVWLGSAILCCGCCTGALIWQPPEDSKNWADTVGVWLILTAPAWPLAAIGLWTLGLHGLVKRWWTSVGPNIFAGAATGCGLWFVVFMIWVFVAIAVEEGG